MIGYENQLCCFPKIDFVASSNEHSGIKNNTDIGNLFKNADLTSKNLIECSDVGLSDNQVFMTRLENNLNNIIRLSDNPYSFGLECSSEFDTCEYYSLVFSQNAEAYEMNKKIEISKETDEIIRRAGRMGETYDDVIQRIFSTAYVCDFCCNQE